MELKDSEEREEDRHSNAMKLETYLESDRFLDHLKQILPQHLDSDRFSTLALRHIRKSNELKQCTLESVATSIMDAGKLGLEPDTNGECWVIPRQEGKGKDRHWEASLQIGYLGHLALGWRSEKISAVLTDVVVKGDTLDFKRGTDGYLHHIPKKFREINADTIEWAYAIVRTIYGGEVWQIIDAREIERLRTFGPSGNSPAWRDWYDQMAMGKVLKRTLKFCPKSTAMSTAISIDDRNDANLRPVIDIDLPALPASVPRSNPEADEMLRQAAEKRDAPPQEREREPEPVPAAQSKPKPQEGAASNPLGW